MLYQDVINAHTGTLQIHLTNVSTTKTKELINK